LELFFVLGYTDMCFLNFSKCFTFVFIFLFIFFVYNNKSSTIFERSYFKCSEIFLI
jgi:hypothetical protein